MMKRGIWLAVLALAVAETGMAEPMRPLLTKENRFPALRQAEVGALVEFVEFTDNVEQEKTSDANRLAVMPTARYRIAEELTLRADLPVGNLDPDAGGSEFGLGDLAVGMELLAFEDLFRFPYVIPHATLKLDTGDEDTTLGDGETSAILGVTVGSQVYDVPVHFNMDASYEIMENSGNIAMFSASLLWSLSDRFSVLVEGRLTDEEPPPGAEEHPALAQGGMIYEASDTLLFGVYGGGYKNAEEDVVATFRVVKEL
jgi:hypothetical protein